MKRIVQPEILDTLPPDDPRAIGSRRDLCRVNAWMGNRQLMAGMLLKMCNGRTPKRITEMGAGDGKFLLQVAGKMASRWDAVSAGVIDRQKAVAPETVAAFDALGWSMEMIVADVFDLPAIEGDVVIANLFLHHFEDERLAELLGKVARGTELFIAIEPRRGAWPWFGTKWLWAIGCNYVTRNDATISVRAGFCGDELSRLWPDKSGWQLTERDAGAFSHCFIARKISAGKPVVL